MKTAVDYIVEMASELGYVPSEFYAKAKELEKEQIKTAFESGWNWNFNAEKYYNETYNPAPYQHKANEFKDNDRIEINPITGDVKIITNEKD